MRSLLKSLFVLGLCTLSLASPQDSDDHHHGRGGGGDNDDTDDSNSSASPTPTGSSTATNSTSSNSALIGMNGDAVCTDLLCVGGLVNGSTVTYTLQSLGAANLGWMAMGFGAQMANTPMVIMWSNSDGSITLSQRKAPAEIMPTVDSNPPRKATAEPSLSSLSGSNPKLAFTIPADSSVGNSIIWAFSTNNPGDSAEGAQLVQHLNSGPTSLNLANTISASSRDPTNPISTLSGGSSSGSGSGSGTGSGSVSIPLQSYQKMLVAHGLLSTIGFLIILPIGALLARYLRTFSNTWFRGHWIIQLALGGPIIIAGVALGFAGVHQSGAPHVADDHKRWGIAIFVLYFGQIALGTAIHYIKPRSFVVNKRRPLQNYFHAVLGLLIIALAFYQVRTGFMHEWPTTTGRSPVSNAANIVWYIWVVLMPVLYAAGLILLRRQFKQERVTKQDPAVSRESSDQRYYMRILHGRTEQE
ncbi:unnamed protein product [Somion occarium]|uniref:Cytochrome b561 domain-containing protein n=1 Tax=Somion occarium TaxID=3059160 RepID=A0ABP1DFF7_9APHY